VYSEHPQTIYINLNGVKKLLTKCNNVYPSEFADMFEIKLNTKYLRKEIEIVTFISYYLNELDIKYEYQKIVNKYKIDLHISEFKLAIKIDEFNHKDRNIKYEKEREIYISKSLSCIFLRFNPDDKKFNLFKCIAIITKYFRKTKQIEIDKSIKLEDAKTKTTLEIESKLKMEEEKTKQLELQIELLKLTKFNKKLYN
jgi:very-short-patch-repair endonuclease